MYKYNIDIFLILVAAFTLSVLSPSFSSVQAQAVYELKFSTPQLLQKGHELLNEGDNIEAKKVYEKALKQDLTDSQTANAHNGLCVVYIMEEIWETAMDHCNRAIRLYPQNWRFYNNRGNIFLETGMLEKAISEYERGLKLSPSSDILKKNLDLAQARLGN